MTLKVGDAAPSFRGMTNEGKEVSLASYRGKKLVLYFYPKDNTPGCTKEACSFRDHISEIRDKGAEVLGVSSDNESSHQRFATKYRLNFPLLADPDRKVGKAYGAIGGLFGLVGLARRWTFVIDEDGKIAHIFQKVNAGEHADEVLAVL